MRRHVEARIFALLAAGTSITVPRIGRIAFNEDDIAPQFPELYVASFVLGVAYLAWFKCASFPRLPSLLRCVGIMSVFTLAAAIGGVFLFYGLYPIAVSVFTKGGDWTYFYKVPASIGFVALLSLMYGLVFGLYVTLYAAGWHVVIGTLSYRFVILPGLRKLWPVERTDGPHIGPSGSHGNGLT
jgi:hypothetical protein